MPATMDVFVLGDAAGPASLLEDFVQAESLRVTLRVIPTGACTAAEFANSSFSLQLSEGETDFAALVVGSDRETLRGVAIKASLLGLSGEEDNAAQVMIERIDASLLVDPTGSYSLEGVRFLLVARAAHGSVVFRRSKLRQIGPLRPVAEPVWDWLIRAVRSGLTIDSEPISDNLTSTACRLPLLAPPQPGKASKAKGRINWATTGTPSCTGGSPIIPTPNIGFAGSAISRSTVTSASRQT